MKVFLSHDMHGLDESQVMEIRRKATELLSSKYGEIEIIDNYHHTDIPENAGRLWHLGTSIRQMEEADAIYFCDLNSTAKGCLIETLVATLYHLRILNSEMAEVITDPVKIKEIVNNEFNNKENI